MQTKGDPDMTFLAISAIAIVTIGVAHTVRLVTTDGLAPIATRKS